jgi:beta-glucosidase
MLSRKFLAFTLSALWGMACMADPFLVAPENGKRIDSLLAKMTPDEKVGQLVQHHYQDRKEFMEGIRRGTIGSFLNIPPDPGAADRLQKIAVEESRMGIPLLFGLDVIHGYRTIFPIPLAESSSWDPALAERNARIAAREAASCGVRWTFAPMVDIARDPRWGRIAEGSGEDPFLGSAFARARVRGFQGSVLSDPSSIAACAKHFAAYGWCEGGRDYNSADVSERTLREVVLPPFKAAVDEGCATLMGAFNEIAGVPASINDILLDGMLRQEWGFGGFVVSDWDAIGELLSHGVAETRPQAGAMALSAGLDMDMFSGIFENHLAREVREGRLDEKTVDRAVRRVLGVKLALGLFERPYTDRNLALSVMPQVHMDQALEAARRSIVLLKNEGGVLPLNKGLKTIAVVGPLADSRRELLGCWSCMVNEKNVVSVLEGIRKKLPPSSRVAYVKGCDIAGGSADGIPEAVDAASGADVIIVVLGEAADMSGEAASRSDLGLPGVQQKLLEALAQTGKPVVLVLANGRPLALPWAAERVPAIVESWQLGTQHGAAVADVVFGDFNPGGKLTVSFPRTAGQVPVYYNHKNTGRPARDGVKFTSKYIDCPSAALYPFGYGLGYASFRYGNLKIEPREAGRGKTVNVSAVVANTGKRSGDEIVQLYIRDRVASVTRPVKELKGFSKIALQPGESKTVSFALGPDELGLWNRQMQWTVESGEFQVWVGPNSAEGIEGSFKIVE